MTAFDLIHLLLRNSPALGICSVILATLQVNDILRLPDVCSFLQGADSGLNTSLSMIWFFLCGFDSNGKEGQPTFMNSLHFVFFFLTQNNVLDEADGYNCLIYAVVL